MAAVNTNALQHALEELARGRPEGANVDPRRIYVGNLRGAKATDIFTAKGASGGETYQPMLTYHGERA